MRRAPVLLQLITYALFFPIFASPVLHNNLWQVMTGVVGFILMRRQLPELIIFCMRWKVVCSIIVGVLRNFKIPPCVLPRYNKRFEHWGPSLYYFLHCGIVREWDNDVLAIEEIESTKYIKSLAYRSGRIVYSFKIKQRKIVTSQI